MGDSPIDMAKQAKQIMRLDNEVNKLTIQLKEKATALTNQKAKNENIQTELRIQKEENRRLNQALSAIKAQSAQATTLLEQARERASESDQAKQSVMQDMREMETTVSRLEGEASLRDEMLEAKMTEMEKLKSMFRATQGDADSGRQTIAALNTELEESRRTVGELKPLLETTQAELQEVTERNAQAAKRIEELSADLAGAETELSEARTQLERRTAELDALKLVSADLESRSARAEGASDTANVQLTQMKRQLIAQSTREDSLRRTIRDLESELKTAKEDIKAGIDSRERLEKLLLDPERMRKTTGEAATEDVLLMELEKKDRLLQWYITHDGVAPQDSGFLSPASTLSGTPRGDRKNVIRRLVPNPLSVVSSGSKGVDPAAQEEVETLRKVLEDVMLQNIALQDNVEMLGEEVTRLTLRKE
ncbi:Chromosome partition protein Smc [Carpediemonas membranifera]|uniref:Chromosome partition protein Smc n=1 Tax=Carpediemonas membranifera TaxID=201153 RepID=A0A8J6B3F4_9EUKA|nr:Chromosome partition protein Smc [Carpediemonas membranifera]|eukprot:KAG9393469.1 Chromosome partition protein Smc [Carpediemonas membranifera]